MLMISSRVTILGDTPIESQWDRQLFSENRITLKFIT